MRNIIFDLFGTLLNENNLYERFFDYLHNKYQIGHIKTEDYFQVQRKFIFSNSSLSFRNIILESLNSFFSNQIVLTDLDFLFDLYKDLDFHSGRLELLTKLSSSYNLYILSNTDTAIIKEIKSLQENHFHFKNIITSSETKIYKPNSQAYLKALEIIGSDFGNTIFCSDTEWDYYKAKELGFVVYNTEQLTPLISQTDLRSAAHLVVTARRRIL